MCEMKTNNPITAKLLQKFLPQFIYEMADCLWYYHMTDGRPELQDMIRKQDATDIKDLFTSTAYDIYAQNLVLQEIYPNGMKKLPDVIAYVYGKDSDEMVIVKDFFQIHEKDTWYLQDLWTDAVEDRRLQQILCNFQQMVLERHPWQTEDLALPYPQMMQHYTDHLHNLQR